MTTGDDLLSRRAENRSRSQATTQVSGQLKRAIPVESGIFLVVCAVFIIGSFVSSNFLTLSNLSILLLNGAVIGFLCLGQSFVLLTGGIDLSTGSVVAMTCVLAAVMMEFAGIPWYAAALLTLGIGAFTGAINGYLVGRTGVPAFIVTFAMMGVAASIPQIITGDMSIRVKDGGYAFIGQGHLLSIPMPVILLCVAALLAIVVLGYTVFGAHIYAVGGNSDAARLAGVKIDRIRVLVYSISGVCAAVGGLIYGSRLMSGYPTAGRGDELFFSIASAVVGGVSLFGGVGTILGAMLGAVLIAAISDLMNVANVSSYWQPLVIGLIILAGAIMDTFQSKRKLSFPWIGRRE